MIGLKPTTPWSTLHHCIILGSSFQQQSVQKSSFSSSSSGAAASTQVKSILKQPASVKHGEEIQQESLKTTIQSAITDIEQGMYYVPCSTHGIVWGACIWMRFSDSYCATSLNFLQRKETECEIIKSVANIYSVTCQLLVVFPAIFDQFSSWFSKKTTLWDSTFVLVL